MPPQWTLREKTRRGTRILNTARPSYFATWTRPIAFVLGQALTGGGLGQEIVRRVVHAWQLSDDPRHTSIGRRSTLAPGPRATIGPRSASAVVAVWPIDRDLRFLWGKG